MTNALHDNGKILVDVRDIGKNFGHYIAVSNLTFRLHAGHSIAFLGANGGGKTTSLRMLAGLLPCDVGDGDVMGRSIRSKGYRTAASAYMPQKINLYGDLSVIENLRFRAELFGQAWRPVVAEALQRFHLHDVQMQKVKFLSEGWARRVQLAATLMTSPELVLLDEPTAGLDPLARAEVWGWIAAMSKAGAGVIVSTHDVDEAAACDQIIIFISGAVKASGSAQSLMQSVPNAKNMTDVIRALASQEAGSDKRRVIDPMVRS